MQYLLVLIFFCATQVFSQQTVPAAQIKMNNVAVWVQADGLTGNPSVYDSKSAITYPAGILSVVYQDGFVWGGLVKDGQEPRIRVGGNTYVGGNSAGIIQSDLRPGELTRIWHIRKDFNTADLRLDAAIYANSPSHEVTPAQITAFRNQLKTDWLEWPAHLGAPFYDADGDGIYSPQLNADSSPLLYPEADEPGYANADQVLWLVYNDADSAKAVTFAGSPPIGLEVQVTLWAYKTPILENVIYKRWKILYKGTPLSTADASIDSMFVCPWSDPDLGDYNDDLAGFDEERMMFYAYNSTNHDADFSEISIPSPALGYDLMAGPAIETGNPQDSAIIDFHKIINWKNQPFHSAWIENPGGSDSDPMLGNNYNATIQWYNVLLGFRPRPETPRFAFTNPWTYEEVFFHNTGDPLTQSGWLDLYPGDRRIFPCTGPFSMALGDTQEVVLAIIVGQGENRLDSIKKLRQTADIAQAAFNNNAFRNIPSAQVETQIFNGTASIHIYAQADSSTTQAITAQLVDAQGHIYFEENSAQSHILEMHLQNTKQIDEGLFLNLQTINENGQDFLWPKVQRNITTSGPLRINSVEIFDDNINADRIANPGEYLRFGVTLLNSSDFDKPNLLCRLKTEQINEEERIYERYVEESFLFDSIPAHSTATMHYNKDDRASYFTYQIPQDVQPGQMISIPVKIYDQKNNLWEDTLQIRIEVPVQPLNEFLAEHIAGPADGSWGIRLIDVSQIKNHDYQIAFNGNISVSHSNVILLDLTIDSLLFSGPVDARSRSLDMPVIDGIRLTTGTLILDTYIRGWSYSNEAGRWFSASSAEDSIALQFISPGSNYGYSSITTSQDKDIEIRFVEKTGYSDLNGNEKFDIGEPYTLPEQGLQKGWFYNLDTEYKPHYEGFFDLPFTVWDIASPAPRQLAAVILDRDANLQWDLNKWYTEGYPDFVDVNGGRIYNYLFVLDMDYDPLGFAYDASSEDRFFNIYSNTLYPILWMLRLNGRDGYEQLGSAGVLQLFKNVVPDTADVYTFNPHKLFVGVSEKSAPETFRLLQNYPNPFNPQTTIAFSLPQPEHVQLKIYNILGQEIATLIDQKMAAGDHIQVWQGLDNRKNPVASGVFFYKLKAGKFKAVKKMAVVR
ncbi:MAG: T9SS type A sorting domain-containing protein [Deferribacteres bacterium]|nr:T9SS type A sorting domain-containing protein [candidate division KSB1 bacterium]MCB9501871.1 T9SS type A sorting domain-containing protein [Deferribacteres bacterium]